MKLPPRPERPKAVPIRSDAGLMDAMSKIEAYCKDMDAYATTLESMLKAQAEWRPIAEAPRDKSLVFFADNSKPYKSGIFIGQSCEEYADRGWDINRGEWVMATHWKPCDAPPASADGGK